MTGPALETRALAIGYQRRGRPDNILARELNLSLWRGQLIGLLGPNGIGKSTLLRTLAGMRKPISGQVLLGDAEIAAFSPGELARRLSLVLTAAAQPNLMNGYALVALGRHPHTDWIGRLRHQDRAAIVRALAAVGAQDLAERPVAELSDGQRQKLMIARALAQESAIMLLDEPTAYLDLPRRVETMQLLKRIAHSAGRAILVSTHELDLALRSCNRLWLMSEEGIAAGAPEDLALDGRLGATFQADGIHFNQLRGTFAPDPPPGPAVSLSGEGTPLIWMRRALERSGYTVGNGAAAVNISLRPNGKVATWQLKINGGSSSHRLIQDVLDALEGQKK